MDNKDLLQAIGDLLDEKLDKKLDARFADFEKRFEKKIDKKLDVRFVDFEKKIDKKFDEKLEPIYKKLEEHDHRFDRMTDSIAMVMESQTALRIMFEKQIHGDIESMNQNIRMLTHTVADLTGLIPRVGDLEIKANQTETDVREIGYRLEKEIMKRSGHTAKKRVTA